MSGPYRTAQFTEAPQAPNVSDWKQDAVESKHYDCGDKITITKTTYSRSFKEKITSDGHHVRYEIPQYEKKVEIGVKIKSRDYFYSSSKHEENEEKEFTLTENEMRLLLKHIACFDIHGLNKE